MLKIKRIKPKKTSQNENNHINVEQGLNNQNGSMINENEYVPNIMNHILNYIE